ncbi:hypothetical protein BKA63DRAFT_485456 [Paraphoma chrysanthemicola]|nr:hypothetical protein BKA63DRAFT_485456 [Paraphoma chrysanthemicola]
MSKPVSVPILLTLLHAAPKSQSRPLILPGLDLSMANRFLAPRRRRRAGHYNETRLAREAAGLTSSVKQRSLRPEKSGFVPAVVHINENSFLGWTCRGPPTSRMQQLPDDDKDAYDQGVAYCAREDEIEPCVQAVHEVVG